MKKLLIFLIFILVGALGIFAWLGGFSSVKISEQKAGALHLLYLEHTGPYNKIYPVLEKVVNTAKENQVNFESTFGIYYDDPKHATADKLRSIAGVIVNDDELAKAEKLVKDGKLKHRTIKEQNYAKTEFPYKNMLSMFIAISKVYPAYNRYANEHKYPEMVYKIKDYENDYIMEIYKKDKIEYLMTLPGK